jgi:3-oxoacyl-[acyl-carrier protein] reductase
MLPQRQGKIISLSGGGATGSRPNFSSYAVAKTGIVRFSEILADELREYNIQVNCVAPGAMATALLDEVAIAGASLSGKKEFDIAVKIKKEGGVSLERAAQLVAFLSSAASDGVTGKIISAVWDPWAQFPEHQQDLAKSDIYTLRRIVPKDRGMDWGDV